VTIGWVDALNYPSIALLSCCVYTCVRLRMCTYWGEMVWCERRETGPTPDVQWTSVVRVCVA